MKLYESTECARCRGAGRCVYGDTSTWHQASIAGQAMTPDICDVCWGSGDSAKPWTNLRERATESHQRRARIKALEAMLKRVTDELEGLHTCYWDFDDIQPEETEERSEQAALIIEARALLEGTA